MIPNLDGSHAIVGALVGVAFWLSRALYVSVQSKRYQNGHDRRRPVVDAALVEWRAAMSKDVASLLDKMEATRVDLHDIRDRQLYNLALKVAVIERDVQHLRGAA